MKHYWTTVAVTALCALAAPAWSAPQVQYLHLIASKHLRGETDDTKAKGKAGKHAKTTKSAKADKTAKKGKAAKGKAGKGKAREERAPAAHETRAERLAAAREAKAEKAEKAKVSKSIKTVAPAPVKVGKGDTLIGLSRKTGVPVEELAKLNDLKKPYHVRIGSKLKLPARRYYVVKSGDTLFSLARRFGVDANDLTSYNDIELGKSIRSGQKLYLPSSAADTSEPEKPARVERPPPSRPTPIRPQPQQTYTLPGETTPPTVIQPATPQPYAPPPASNGSSQAAPAFTSPPVVVGPSAPRPTPPSNQGFELAPDRGRAQTYPVPGPSSSNSRPSIIQTNPPPSSNEVVTAGRGKFLWPVDGQVLSGFGTKSDGQRNDGLNILADSGDPVRAAADGEVVYAGDQVPSFGNLVLVKHQGGWVTAYAHMSRILVKNRDQVVQGQQVGAVGQTGSVDRPQLHFEIRYAPSPKDKAVPIDPGLLLPGR